MGDGGKWQKIADVYLGRACTGGSKRSSAKAPPTVHLAATSACLRRKSWAATVYGGSDDISIIEAYLPQM
jgi:hypothetical protein